MRKGRISRTLLTLIFTIFYFCALEAKEVKVFRRGKISIVDETQFKFPNDYSFDDDDEKQPDSESIYDENLPYLPKYILYRRGSLEGWARVPIVTKKGPTWTTLRPPTKLGDKYITWSTPNLLPVTKPPVPPTVEFTESPMVEPVEPPMIEPAVPIEPPMVEPAVPVETILPPQKELTASSEEFIKPETKTEVKKVKEVIELPPLNSHKKIKEKVASTTPSTTTSTTPSTTTSTTPSTTTSTNPPTTTTEAPVSRVTKFRPVFKARNKFNSTTTETLFPAKPFTPEFQIDNMIQQRLKTGAVHRAVLPQQRNSEVADSGENDVDVPLPSDPLEDKLSNFHFRKFAQRFGSIRILPPSATTKASVIVASPVTVTSSPVTVRPSPVTARPAVIVTGPEHLEQKVKSNTLVLRPEEKHNFFLPSNVAANQNHFAPDSSSTTSTPKVVHRWSSSWSSWSSWGPDGKVHTGSTKTFTTFDAPETTTPTPRTRTTRRVHTTTPRTQTTTPNVVTTTPRIQTTTRRPSSVTVRTQQVFFRNVQPSHSSSRKPSSRRTSFSNQGIISSSQIVSPGRNNAISSRPNPSTNVVNRMVSRPRVFKPPIIHPQSGQRYKGPTYNCRVLTPEKDGRPSSRNDPNCPLKYPGFPADDSCKCTYEVEGRDEHGCATGFLYTCAKK